MESGGIKKAAKDDCPYCRNKEIDQLKSDLFNCKKSTQAKDKKIRELDKRVFTLTIIAVAIGVIFGKETLDNLVEWLDSIHAFKSGASSVTEVVTPAPGTLAMFGLALLPIRRRKRRA
jgi:MYXO-CTERM domain-containing protein